MRRYIKGLRVEIEIFYMNRCLVVGCFGPRLEITNINRNLNLCLEYQSE